MNIDCEIKEGVLLLKVVGRLSFDNAGELENIFLHNYQPGLQVKLNLSSLDYISSAGLRVLLTIDKRLSSQGCHLIIVGVKPEVMEVFSETGFDQILTFEDIIPTVDLSHATLLGEGMCGEVYQMSQDTILKLYKDGYRQAMIEKEKKYAKEALILGIPTAISLNIVRQGNRYGILFELINAKSLKKVMVKDYAHVENYVHQLVDLIKIVHHAVGDPTRLPDRLQEQIALVESADWLSAEEKKKVFAIIDSLPQAKTCIHGDFHPGNVMYNDGEPVFIDMGDFAIGHPYQDISQFANIFHDDEPQGFGEKMTGLDDEKRHHVYDLFMQYYFDNPSPEELAKIEGEYRKFMMIRQFFFIANFPSTREANIKRVRHYLANYR